MDMRNLLLMELLNDQSRNIDILCRVSEYKLDFGIILNKPVFEGIRYSLIRGPIST
jgi:hypothetical protein